MKVSILIPMYNAEEYIEETLISAISQSWRNIEVIVVDDGSTDNSCRIVESYCSDIVKLYKQENQGGCVARNLAFSKADGDYIQYLDADDILAQDKIEIQMGSLAEYKYDRDVICMGNYWGFKDSVNEPNLLCPMRKLLHSYDKASDAILEIWNNNFNSFPYSVYLIHSDLIKKVGDWNIALHRSQDSEFMARVLSRASKIIYTERAFFYYRNRPNSVSRKKIGIDQVESELIVNKKITDILLTNYSDENVRKICGKRFAQFAYNYFPLNRPMLGDMHLILKNSNLSLNWDERGQFFNLLNLLFGWKIAKRIIRFSRSLKRSN